MKTAVIFGHSSGLGFELSKVFIGKNVKVIGISRKSSPIKSDFIENVSVDLSKDADIEKVIKLINEKYHKFNYLIYCSGYLTSHLPENVELEELMRIYKVNVIAPIKIESSLRQVILKNEADIINVTSTCVSEYYFKYEEYASTKAAFQKFTSDLKNQYENTKVRVMEFRPDGFQSNVYKNMTGEHINRNESEEPEPKYLAQLIFTLLGLPKNIEIPLIELNTKYV